MNTEIKGSYNKAEILSNAKAYGVEVGNASCPKCGQPAFPNGMFFSGTITDIPLKIRVLFFNITLGLAVNVGYCPRCGHLAIKINKS
jgi:ribosomal protein S27AE